MNPLEIVTLAVVLGAFLVSLLPGFRLGGAFSDRRGTMWFESDEDHSIADLPYENAVDAPIPRRPLRTRF